MYKYVVPVIFSLMLFGCGGGGGGGSDTTNTLDQPTEGSVAIGQTYYLVDTLDAERHNETDTLFVSSFVGDRETAVQLDVEFSVGLSLLSWVGASRALPLEDSELTFIFRVYEGDISPNDVAIYEITQVVNAEYLFHSNGIGRYLFSYDASDSLELHSGNYWLSIQGTDDNSFYWEFDPEMFGKGFVSASKLYGDGQNWENSSRGRNVKIEVTRTQ